MGGGSTKDIVAGGLGFAVGGPAGAAIGVGASRKARGKGFIGKDIKNLGKVPGPDTTDLPEFPTSDAGADLLAQRALLDRLRRQMIRGSGIKGTIKTSPRGVTDRAPTIKRQLREA
jgi:hypothetical protein